MATAVTIQIRVDGVQAGAAIDQINSSLAEVGIKGSASLQKAGAEMENLGRHTSTSLDGVRLMSQEFGFRMPRALEAMASRVPAITSAISAMMGAFTSVAIIEILARIGEAAYKAFDIGGQQARAMQKAIFYTALEMRRMNTEIDVQIDKLQQEQAKLEHKPFNAMKLTMDEAAEAADHLASKLEEVNTKFQKDVVAKGSDGGMWDAFKNLISSNAGTGQEQSMMDDHTRYLNQAKDLQGILSEDGSYMAALRKRLTGLQQDAKGYGAGEGTDYYNKEIAALQSLIEHQQNEYNVVKATIDLQKQNASTQATRDKADADRIAAEQARAAQEAAKRTEEEREADIKAQEAASKKLMEDANQFAKQWNDAVRGVRDAKTAGLTGAARIVATQANRDSDIDIDLGPSDPRTPLEHQKNAIQAAQAMDALNQENAEKQVKAAKEAAEMQAQIEDAETAYAKQAAEAQRHAKQMGLTGWIDDYKNAVAAIQAQDEAEMARLDKLQLKAAQSGHPMSDEQYAQAKVNIERQADAQIEALNQQMAHQVSSTLQAAYTNPIDFIKRKMQQMMFDILAQWLVSLKTFQAVFGSTMGGMGTGSATGTGGAVTAQGGIGGVMSSIMRGSAPWSHASAPPASSDDSPMTPPVLIHAGTGGASSFMGGGSGSGGTIAGQIAAASAPPPPGIGGGISTLPGMGGGMPQLPQVSTPTFPGSTGATGAGAAQMKQAGGYAGAAMGGYMLYQDSDAAFRAGSAKGTLKGAMGDAAAGAAIGSVIPGVGTAIGAAAGALIGIGSGIAGAIMGEGGNLAARDYYRKTLFPEIEAMRNGGTGMDFQAEISGVDRTASDGMSYMTQHWGGSAAQWVDNNYLKKEVALATAQIEALAKGGAEYTKLQAVQFHSGGDITGFGSLGTSSSEGFIHAMLGEKMMNPGAASAHGPYLDAMNGGASPSDIASMYLAGSSRPSSPGGSASGDTHHYTINAMDAKSFDHYLRNGGARQIVKHTNNYNSQYGGDGISG